MARETKRRVFSNALAILLVSIGLPLFLGLGLLSASVIIPLASLSVFLVADLVADSFAGQPVGLDSRKLIQKVTFCVLIGWAGGLAILASGLLGMNAMFWTGELQLPPAIILLDALVLSLAACVLVAGIALAVCRKARSPRTAKLTLKVMMVSSTLLLLYGCNRAQMEGLFLPTTDRITRLTWIAAVCCLANGAALVALGVNGLPSRRPKTQGGSE